MSAPPMEGRLGTVAVGLGAGVSVEAGVSLATGRLATAVVAAGDGNRQG